MSGFTRGFNPQEVASSVSAVKSSYDKLIDACVGEMHTFVEEMSAHWAATNAVKTFVNVKKANDGLTTAATTTFQSVVEAMNGAASSWAQATGNAYNGSEFEPTVRRLSVGAIKDNIDGASGCDDEALTLVENLTTIAQHIDDALSEAISAVSNCGFLGSEAGALTQALTTIKSNFSEQATENYNNIKEDLNKTFETYGSIESTNQSNFNGGGN
mgnify:CR=1 FL=1